VPQIMPANMQYIIRRTNSRGHTARLRLSVHMPKAWANPLPAKMHLKQLAIVCAANGIMTISELGKMPETTGQLNNCRRLDTIDRFHTIIFVTSTSRKLQHNKLSAGQGKHNCN